MPSLVRFLYRLETRTAGKLPQKTRLKWAGKTHWNIHQWVFNNIFKISIPFLRYPHIVRNHSKIHLLSRTSTSHSLLRHYRKVGATISILIPICPLSIHLPLVKGDRVPLLSVSVPIRPFPIWLSQVIVVLNTLLISILIIVDPFAAPDPIFIIAFRFDIAICIQLHRLGYTIIV